jgi:hypothetical protein
MEPMSETQTPPEEPAHDVLAAEAFAMPGADPSLQPRPIELPGDPTGIEEPHDILAAEEFAMPAVPMAAGRALVRRGAQSWQLGLSAALGALFAIWLLRAIRGGGRDRRAAA